MGSGAVNDAPAFAPAGVGIAIGAGTDLAAEAGHIGAVLMSASTVIVAINGQFLKRAALWPLATGSPDERIQERLPRLHPIAAAAPLPLSVFRLRGIPDQAQGAGRFITNPFQLFMAELPWVANYDLPERLERPAVMSHRG